MDTPSARSCRHLGFAAWALLVGAAQAQELPQSPACRTALQSLNTAEDAIADAAAAPAAMPDPQRQRAVTARLQPLRQRVADACLGGLTTSPPPSQRTWVVPAVPAVPARAGDSAARASRPETPTVSVPVPRFEPPITVGPCNAVTCLASDGSRLTRVGPTLVGPRGTCTMQGRVLHCP